MNHPQVSRISRYLEPDVRCRFLAGISRSFLEPDVCFSSARERSTGDDASGHGKFSFTFRSRWIKDSHALVLDLLF